MPQKLILIRHGHTAHNKRKILQGWLDTELDEIGINQAKKLAERLTSFKIDAIYTSDLKRAKRTAQEITRKLGQKFILTSHLREDDLGVLQGKEWLNLPRHLKTLWDARIEAAKNKEIHWKEHQGESLAEIYHRLTQLFHLLKTKHSNQQVLLVTHGGTINHILELLKLKEPQNPFISFHNTSITILEKTSPNNYIVKLLNDASHLE